MPPRTRIPRLAAVVALGLTVLLGWALDISMLKSVFPRLVTMKANAALCFMLAGTALWLTERQTPKAARFIAGGMLVIVALTLSEQLADLNLGIDELLVQDPDLPEPRVSGRMALATAVAFLLSGLTLLALPCISGQPRLGMIAGGFSIAVSLIGALAILGYGIHLELLYTWYAFGSSAPNVSSPDRTGRAPSCDSR
ncbi:MAG: hypothetical protein ACRERU_08760 [Methylococcales bacterium]